MKINNSGRLQNFARRTNFTNKRTYLTWGNAFNKTKGNKSILVKVKKNIIVQVDPGGHCQKVIIPAGKTKSTLKTVM